MQIHPKVTAASIAGLVVTLTTVILNALGASFSPDVSVAVSTVLSGLAGYLTPSSAPLALRGPQAAPQAGSEEPAPIL